MATSNAPASIRWEALGSTAVLQTTDHGALGPARAIVERELEELDRACSRFRGDSDLQRVNAGAGRFVAAGELLIEALEVALRAAELTDGDVDPTVGNALVLAGYDRDWRLLSTSTEDLEQAHRPARIHAIEQARSPARIHASITPGWQAVEIDREHAAIRIPTGVSLDLGATAKAWAADRAAEAVHAATGSGSLVGLGGDIATAGAAPEEGWRIYVTDDHRNPKGREGQTISIASGGLATSSTAVRRWSHEGQIKHHIIDPHSGAPVTGSWRTVSVAAETCLDANIASTAALIRARSAPEWLQQLGLPARLVGADGVVRLVSDWPAERGP